MNRKQKPTVLKILIRILIGGASFIFGKILWQRIFTNLFGATNELSEKQIYILVLVFTIVITASLQRIIPFELMSSEPKEKSE